MSDPKARRNFRTMAGLVWRSDRRAVSLVLILLPINSVSGAALTWAIKLLIDAVADGDVSAGYRAGGFAAIAAGVMSVAWLWQHNLERLVSDKVSMQLDHEVLDVVASAPGIEHFERSDYLDRIDLVVDQGRDLAGSVWAVTDIIATAIRLALAAWLLSTVSPWLMMLPVFALPVMWFSALSRRIIQKVELDVAEDARRRDALHDLFIEPASAKEMSVFGVGSRLSDRSGRWGRSVIQRRFRSGMRAGLVASGGWIIYSMALGWALLSTIDLVVGGSATLGDLLLVWGVGEEVRFHLSSIAHRIQELLRSLDVFERFTWLVDWSAELRREWMPATVEPVPTHLTKGIELDNVSFRYPGTDVLVLESVSVSLEAGSVVAIVGDNGAGKTTLIKLLLGLYRPTEGTIHVDGVPIGSFDPDDWHGATSATYQDLARIEATVGTTVGLGDVARISDEAGLRTAIDRAAATNMLAVWPEGLATKLGRSYHRGVEPSGGQWQRLAIARTMFPASPLLLVLDEPTSAIDPLHESELLRRYASASEAMRVHGGVTLLISHRFASVALADRIIVLQNGRIIEQGPHGQLMGRNGRYAEMFRRQQQAYEQ